MLPTENASPIIREPPRLACLGGCLLLLIPAAIGLVVLLIVLAENDPAIEQTPTLRALLRELAAEVEASERSITLTLHVPVGGENVWLVEAGGSTRFDDFSEEFFCLVHTEDATTRHCIPYGNIAGVSSTVGDDSTPASD